MSDGHEPVAGAMAVKSQWGRPRWLGRFAESVFGSAGLLWVIDPFGGRESYSKLDRAIRAILFSKNCCKLLN